MTLAELLAYSCLKHVSASSIVEAAVRELAGGSDSPALRQLAGADPSDERSVQDLLRQAALELGFESLGDREAAVDYLAREIAREIVSGETQALAGAREIWELTLQASVCSEALDPFIYAASEADERPEDRILFEQGVLEAAQAVLSERP